MIFFSDAQERDLDGGDFTAPPPPPGSMDQPGVLFILVLFLYQSPRFSESTVCGPEVDFAQLCLSLVV